MSEIAKLGFIGLGVMGEPMCGNLARKSGLEVRAFDLRPEPLARLSADGVAALSSPAEVAAGTDIVFLSLPGGDELDAVCRGPDGLMAGARPGLVVVDLGTSPVGLSREIAAAFGEMEADYADAPVARTRAAAEAGTLSIMVGAEEAVFERIRPFLDCMGAEISRCGEVGAGQVVKQMNNMVLFQTVIALAEALAVARRAGLDGRVLFETMSKGSADSFALRHHGMKALLPGDFPREAFSTDYALKDLSYALGLAEAGGVRARGAELARELLAAASKAGFGDEYFPSVLKIVDPETAASRS